MRRVLITGANRGLGLALVRQCMERGDLVLAACRQPEKAVELNELGAIAGNQLAILELELSDPDGIAQAGKIAASKTVALDLLINNAGIYAVGENIRTIDLEKMEHFNRVNALGAVLLVQACLDLLKAGEAPVIVNVSSESGSISALDSFRCYYYFGSKALMNMYTRLMAFDPQMTGIRVVAMHPGWVRTDMGGSEAALSPDDSACCILKIAAELNQQNSGKFYTYQGKELPW